MQYSAASVFKLTILVSSFSLSFLLYGCEEDETNSTEGPNVSDSDALIIQSYARDTGLSPKEAQEQLALMQRSGEINEKIEDTFGADSISSTYFMTGKDFGVGVRLHTTTKYGMESLSLDDGTIIPITLTNNEKFNAKGIQDYMTASSSTISEHLSGVQSVGYNGKKNALTITIHEPDISKRMINNGVDLSLLMPDMDANIEYTDYPIVETSQFTNKVIGGAKTYNYVANTQCTTGFPGFVNNVPGFLTATHCQNDTQYQGNDGLNFNLNPSKAYTNYSTLHEMSFVPTPNHQLYGGVLTDQQYVDERFIQKINGVRDRQPVLSQTYLCHFGRTTGASCGFVEEINIQNYVYSQQENRITGCSSKYSPNASVRAQNCGESFYKIRSNYLRCSKGDSGGPVYDYSGKAWGIANSASFSGAGEGQCFGLTFSLIDYAVRDFGFRLKTEF